MGVIRYSGVVKALLIVNRHKAHTSVLAEDIGRRLRVDGVETETLYFDFQNGALSGEERDMLTVQFPPDIVFSIGGDGTVLFAAREFAPHSIPILPIHLGTTGFMSAVDGGEWQPVFRRWLDGQAALSRRMMLQVEVKRKSATIFRATNLNDAVISSEGIAKIIRLHTRGSISKDGQTFDVDLGSFRSDGLIASTPTGSTAYSAAAGGPILDPEMEAIIINPIAPFTLANRPIVTPASERVIVEVEAEQRSGVILTIDGQLTEKLLPLDRVIIKKARHKTVLVESGRAVFYRALRGKLGWSGGNDAPPYQQTGAGDVT
ncbi:MAG: NAD(+)/NADH kinase [Spirochaetaceae bacterium]|jgi:NAD+ kinase|nr:NAD(+)/NADH kinase [Spirochaetaceae bacterium]